MQRAPGKFVRANGIDIHYLEMGSGPPLVLLHGGTASNDPVWDANHWGFNAYLDELSRRFRVLAPDERSHGWTANPDGPASYELLAQDLGAFIEALGVSRPAVIGFSDGGMVAGVLAVEAPDALGPIVNIAGYDLFDPAARSFQLVKQSGLPPDQTRPNLDATQAAGGAWFDAMIASHDAARGEGAWRQLWEDSFGRWTQPGRHNLDDLAGVTVPTLIMAGDRDVFCSPEESVRAHRLVKDSELAIIPNCPHTIAPQMIPIAIEFIERRRS